MRLQCAILRLCAASVRNLEIVCAASVYNLDIVCAALVRNLEIVCGFSAQS